MVWQAVMKSMVWHDAMQVDMKWCGVMQAVMNNSMVWHDAMQDVVKWCGVM